MFPTFATLQEDLDYARKTYLKMIQVVAALIIPLLVMLAVLSPSLIPLILGEKWRLAIFPLQVMAIAGIFRVLSVLSSDMLRAVGFPNLPFKIYLIEGLLVLGALLLVTASGIEVVALTMTVILSVTAWVIIMISCRVLGIRFHKLGQALVPGITLGASGAIPVLSLRLLDLYLLPDGLEAIVLITASSAAMVICLLTVHRRLVQEVIALAGSAKQR
jgi:O-antigen/teichoic acid export membrane protein